PQRRTRRSALDRPVGTVRPSNHRWAGRDRRRRVRAPQRPGLISGQNRGLMLARALTLIVITLVVSAPSPRHAAPAHDAEPPRANRGGPAPFDGELMRLAEILGALHHLRALCGANEGSKWRDQMNALLDAEAPEGERRNRLTAHFNRGFRSF